MDQSASPLLSVAIPTLNEVDALGGLLSDLRPLHRMPGMSLEILIADGGSVDGTQEVAREFGATVISSERGRGIQLRSALQNARGDVFAAFHADVRLPTDALAELVGAITRGLVGPRAFRLGIARAGAKYRAVEKAANLRSRIFALPYGDQGLVLPRGLYYRVNGYESVRLMEDVALALALKRVGAPIRLFQSSVRVSARRWERDGVLRRSARNLQILARYLTGTPADALLALYEDRAAKR